MALSLAQHRAFLTQSVIGVFSDSNTPSLGLSAFFPTVTSKTYAVSIEVQRNRLLYAVDVQRGTDSNKNTFGKFTEKIWVPAFYDESFDFTSTQGYERSFGVGLSPDQGSAEMMIESSAREILALKNKIQRAIERQRASVLQSGIVLMKNGDSIDYKRKARSMPVLTGNAAWNNPSTSDPLKDLDDGGKFLRRDGLSSSNIINAVFGESAFPNFMSNSKVIAAAAIFQQIRRIDIGMPQFDNVTGLVFQGRVATTDHIFNLWTYPDFYENPDGSKEPYILPDNVLLIPSDFEGKSSFGAVPTIFNQNTSNMYVGPAEGEFIVHDVIDQTKCTWDMKVKSAPLVVPFSVDRMYTIKTKS